LLSLESLAEIDELGLVYFAPDVMDHLNGLKVRFK